MWARTAAQTRTSWPLVTLPDRTRWKTAPASTGAEPVRAVSRGGALRVSLGHQPLSCWKLFVARDWRYENCGNGAPPGRAGVVAAWRLWE
jgi:hypothetical protein